MVASRRWLIFNYSEPQFPDNLLTVLLTEKPERVLLRVTRKYSDEVLLEGIVARATLATLNHAWLATEK